MATRDPARRSRPALLALLAACLAVPAAGDALPLSKFDRLRGRTLEIYVSGASAQDNALERLFRLQCQPGTLDIYRAGGNQRVFFCRIRAGARGEFPGIDGFPADQDVAFYKTSIGGSGNGAGPLILRRGLQFINMEDLKADPQRRCPPEDRVVVPDEGAFTGYTEHNCANPKPITRVPDAGVSDVEPRVFAGRFGFTEAQLEGLEVRSAFAVVFGIPVSKNLRDALQAARFAPEDRCHPANPGYREPVRLDDGREVPRGETATCMPSLTRPQLAGIYAGTLRSWRQVVNADGYPLAAVDPEGGNIVTPPGVAPPTDDRVFVCRRVDTSGTQASYEMFFLNQRCADDVAPFARASQTVVLGTGTSNVKACLDYHDRSGTWGVGIFSTENVADLDEDGWRFIRMDRVAPTLLDTFNGRWTFFAEQTLQWRSRSMEAPLEGPKLALMEHIATQAGSPTVIRALNRGFRHSWGDGGVMALNTNNHRPPAPAPGDPVTAARLRDNPVLALSKAPTGQPNNCIPPVAVFPTPAP